MHSGEAHCILGWTLAHTIKPTVFFGCIVEVQTELFIAAFLPAKHTQFFIIQDDISGCTNLSATKGTNFVEGQVRQRRDRMERPGLLSSGLACGIACELWPGGSSWHFRSRAWHFGSTRELSHFEERGLSSALTCHV